MTHPLKWTLLAAQKEFGTHRDTIKARLTQAGEKPADDDTYSTKQIIAALHGDLTAAKLRLTNEQADKVEIENKRARRELIPIADAVEVGQRFCFAVRQKILLSSMPDNEKQEMLVDLNGMEAADYTKGAPNEVE